MRRGLTLLLLLPLAPCWLRGRRAAFGALLPLTSSKAEAQALGRPFEWGFLWKDEPLAEPKRTGLKAQDVAEVLRRDLAAGKYILTGDLTASIFAHDCRFVDPNNAVDGLAKYRQALSFLFDPLESDLRLSELVVEDGKRLRARYVASGTLKLPWRPRIAPWSGDIEYTLNDLGLIQSQVDQWNITRFDAIRQTFTPR